MTHKRYIILDRPSRVAGRSTGVLRDAKNPRRRINSFTSGRNHIPCPRRHTILHKAGVSYLRITTGRASSKMIMASVEASTAIFVALVAKRYAGMWLDRRIASMPGCEYSSMVKLCMIRRRSTAWTMRNYEQRLPQQY